MVVKLLINLPIKTLNRVYDYHVSDEISQYIELGKRVIVNFGNNTSRLEEGIIVKIFSDEEYAFENRNNKKFKLKEIIEVIDEVSYISEEKLKLAKWMSQIYFCNVYDALKLMLPPGTGSKNASKNMVLKTTYLVKLNASIDKINQDIEDKKITSARHIRLIRFLEENDSVIIDDIINGLNISKSVIKKVENNGYIKLEKVELDEDNVDKIEIEKSNITLTDEQKNAIDILNNQLDKKEYSKYLLFGVTGSGKTEVYLQIIQKVLDMNKKVIVLVPEIALTHQTLTRFCSRFGSRVAMLHSKMTINKRKEEYKKIIDGKVDIVIGARSAIFCPIDNLALVIIDEEHDLSYYANNTPKYSTKEVASYICRENNALLLLGSATPEISTYYEAMSGKIGYIEMKKRPQNATLPTIEYVDMKNDRLLGNKGAFSARLKEEILKNISNNEQTMIFLNRRGYSSYLTCGKCGYMFKCPNCDVALTYHKKNNLAICHYCSYVKKNIDTCPNCGNENIEQSMIGTEKIEEELKSIYSNISVLRMDADTTVKRGSHQKILESYKNEKVDVLVGTQMISKGHDIENVTLVGVLGVDSMISMNDYLASQKAYANISQVSGRAGRGKKPGRVIIQTTNEDNYILEAVKNHNFVDFYENEIRFRKKFNYPPFIDIVLVELISKESKLLKEESKKLYEIIHDSSNGIYTVYSPKTPYIEKINNRYKMNILIKCKFSNEFLKIMYNNLLKYDKIKNRNINISITKNPISID